MIAKKCREMIVDIINHSELSIDTIYFMMKDIFNEVSSVYEQWNQQQEMEQEIMSQEAANKVNEQLEAQGEDLENQKPGEFLVVKENAAAAQSETDPVSESAEAAPTADEKKEE